ncbi:hypothetical protein DV515_00014924 [Chloebia gouldiae]|uniref:Uncharacterized protein n=1 Tax=Chloebia gouldiae TaxID=44316 RepID=A0A3L8RX90_CHLGU|nr:hypothetical protein DV515_00014924 [Chloebia gouldiae]
MRGEQPAPARHSTAQPRHNCTAPMSSQTCFLAAHGLPELCWDHASPLTCLQDTSPWVAEGPLGHGTTQWQHQPPGHLPRSLPRPQVPEGSLLESAWMSTALLAPGGHGRVSAAPCPASVRSPALERVHAGVWACHSPARNKPSTARWGWGWARPRWPVPSSQLGVPACAHPPPCHRTRLAPERCSCEHEPRKVPIASSFSTASALARPGTEDPSQGLCRDGTSWGTHGGPQHIPRDCLVHSHG